MTHSAKASRSDIGKIATAWCQLHEKTKIGVIRSQTEYDRMVHLLDGLVDEVGDDESHRLSGLLELVGNLVGQYEESEVSLPDAPPRQVLRFLMEEHDLSQADLRKELGSQGVVSEILSGKREINARQAKALAVRFSVSPASFL
jgi:HTH-type transcriptional regulator/antitoxin HigA